MPKISNLVATASGFCLLPFNQKHIHFTVPVSMLFITLFTHRFVFSKPSMSRVDQYTHLRYIHTYIYIVERILVLIYVSVFSIIFTVLALLFRLIRCLNRAQALNVYKSIDFENTMLIVFAYGFKQCFLSYDPTRLFR